MQSNQLQRKYPNMKRMIVARGGKRGKTSGRGGKGQSARAGNKRRPEWRDIIKRVPKLRGRGKSSHKSFQEIATVINLVDIEIVFSANESVTPTTLIEKRLVSTMSGRIPLVKILGDGEITKAFKISGCAISASAREKIMKAGGSIVDLASRVIVKEKTEAQKENALKPKKEKVAKSEKTDPIKEKAEKSEKKDKKQVNVKKVAPKKIENKFN